MGQNNIFTPVCHSVHRGGGAIPAYIAGGIPACLAGGLLCRGVCCGGVPGSGGVYLLPGGVWWRPPGRLLLRAVRILLECMLVLMFICRFQQNFGVGNLIDDEVFFEIRTTGNYTCNGTTPVAMRRISDSCTSVYFKDKDCDWVDVLPKEELCYVKCKCPDYPSSCDGMVIIHSEPGQLEWGICPLNLA